MFCLQVGVFESLLIEQGPGASSTEVEKGILKDYDEDMSHLLMAAFQSEPQSTFVKLRM